MVSNYIHQKNLSSQSFKRINTDLKQIYLTHRKGLNRMQQNLETQFPEYVIMWWSLSVPMVQPVRIFNSTHKKMCLISLLVTYAFTQHLFTGKMQRKVHFKTGLNSVCFSETGYVPKLKRLMSPSIHPECSSMKTVQKSMLSIKSI